jgi:DNA-binding transcriptional regulator YdaS (Cro superfamily)
MSSRQLLDPNVTYDITMTIAVKSRGVTQEHRGRYRVPPGQARTVEQAVDEIRRTCAQQMGVHVSETSVANCRFTA